ncbi:uncharacterized protein LOC105421313 isoform X3 [Amborella trichopoda]|uniref:uncharacterized protein LOC105421313 isoform X3 n=1 Tax=Amborella trichopoda TaxID=13333 RepID=UPI0009BECF39|nr:uncharacterized protein LOC105421313 isoform X3 [Amborella trichopoda]|eukprot:XP_020528333.1 uncharacterized protein LOC105421313 isoform X3 [Amborella trichopoda]
MILKKYVITNKRHKRIRSTTSLSLKSDYQQKAQKDQINHFSLYVKSYYQKKESIILWILEIVTQLVSSLHIAILGISWMLLRLVLPLNLLEKLFNLCHSSLRNIVERAFGVINGRFPIHKIPPMYSVQSQAKIVIACLASSGR